MFRTAVLLAGPETNGDEIAMLIRPFLAKRVK